MTRRQIRDAFTSMRHAWVGFVIATTGIPALAHAQSSASPSSATVAASDAAASPDPTTLATGSSAAPSDRSAARSEPDAPFNVEQAFGEAVALLQDGRFRDALPILERVRAAREVPAVLYNLAMAHRGLGLNLEALANLERYLQLAGTRLDSSRRSEIETLIVQLRASLVQATIRIPPGEYAVSIDGQPFEPARWNRTFAMNPGEHVFVVTGERIRPLTVSRDFRPGATEAIDLTPERVNAITRLRVEPNIGDAEVFVNHLLVGSGRVDSRVRPGRLEVNVRARGYLPYSGVIALASGQSATLQVRLERDVPVTERWWFWTAVGAVAAGAVIGISLGATSGPPPPDAGSLGTVVSALHR